MFPLLVLLATATKVLFDCFTVGEELWNETDME